MRIRKQLKQTINSVWREDDGVLTFEWIVLITLVTIGIVSGVSTVRDALISELDDVGQSMLAVDQSYTIAHPLVSSVHRADKSAASNSGYRDRHRFTHCERATDVPPPPL